MDKKQLFEGKTYYKIKNTEELQNDVSIKKSNHELKTYICNTYLILVLVLIILLFIIIL